MTLGEAIKHYEELAEEKERDRDVRKIHLDNRNSHNNIVHYQKACECAEEHRQLAEWLKELKRLKEKEPCEDYISRQAVLDYIYNDLGLGDEEYGQDAERQIELAKSYKYVKSLPSVAPQPKIGRWIEHPHEWGDNRQYSRYECSVCHNWEHFDVELCPSCGTKMESEE